MIELTYIPIVFYIDLKKIAKENSEERSREKKNKPQLKSFYLLITYGLMAYYQNVLKAVLARPRPHDNLVSSETEVEKMESFGAPSSHSLNIAFLATTLILMFSKHLSKLQITLIVLFCPTLALCRVMNAMHSIDQVCLGLAIGVWSALFLWHYLYSAVKRYRSEMLSATKKKLFIHGVVAKVATVIALGVLEIVYDCLKDKAG